jgi:plasmid stability protein
MPTMIQVRNVPDAVHRRLKARAAEEGLSLSEFLLGELRRVAERPSRAELLARIEGRDPVKLPTSAARLVRAERDAR